MTVVTYKCRGRAPLRQTVEFTLSQEIVATAPAEVAPGGEFIIVLDPAANQIPPAAGRFTVKEVKNVTLKVPVPANATYHASTLTDGSGLNSTPTATVQGTTIVITIPGPVAGGATIKLPTIILELTAGQSGKIKSRAGWRELRRPGAGVRRRGEGRTPHRQRRRRLLPRPEPGAHDDDDHQPIAPTAASQSAIDKVWLIQCGWPGEIGSATERSPNTPRGLVLSQPEKEGS